VSLAEKIGQARIGLKRSFGVACRRRTRRGPARRGGGFVEADRGLTLMAWPATEESSRRWHQNLRAHLVQKASNSPTGILIPTRALRRYQIVQVMIVIDVWMT